MVSKQQQAAAKEQNTKAKWGEKQEKRSSQSCWQSGWERQKTEAQKKWCRLLGAVGKKGSCAHSLAFT
jgi:hypothetical protein